MKQYTTPKISTKGNDWFVWFRFTHNGASRLIKRRENINRIENLKERLAEIKALCEARTLWLQQGWNPITDPDFKARNVRENKYRDLLFNEAMDFALSQKKVAKKSISTYKSPLEHIKAAAMATGHCYIKAADFKKANVLELINDCRERFNLSNSNYNKHLDVIRLMFSVLIEWEVMEHNPASKIKRLRTAESNKYASLNVNEKRIIFNYLSVHMPRFLLFIQTLYYTGIRPKELLLLKIKDIDFSTATITIAPVMEVENSKTTDVRKVAINQHLLPLLSHFANYNPDHYLFGSVYATGGNRGADPSNRRGARHSDYFAPSANCIKRDTVTKLWKSIVVDKLGIKKLMYALKHTGADDMIMAGITLDALRDMYGHTSKLTTEIYASKVREVNRKQIITLAPQFSSN